MDARVAKCFSVERQILKRLGEHPRIVRYRLALEYSSPSFDSDSLLFRFLGTKGDSILLGEASHGNLQAYLDKNPTTPQSHRLTWCRQIAEAIDHVHLCGVLHSDLRPSNILVHETTPGSRDLQLSDFGGSVCEELGLDGLALPDGPFYSPVFKNESSEMLDLFGLGSVFYTILTSRWPYKLEPGRFETIDDRIDWEERVVYPNFQAEKFPDVDGLPFEDVILKCWRRQFSTAHDVVTALEASKSDSL